MIEIIDNFLPKIDYQTIYETGRDMNFPWYYIPTASFGTEHYIPENAVETPALIHMLLRKDKMEKSTFITNFVPLFDKIEKEFNVDLIRVRLAMKHRQVGFTENNYNIPHVDHKFPHLSMIYYVNESDGDTWLFNEFLTDHTSDDPKEYTVQQRVSPKPNRLLVFNGLQYHTASNPINSNERIMININAIKRY
jgi:hypothetical protein